jgi:hypothetical protein
MARGHPAIWSTLLAVAFGAAGWSVYDVARTEANATLPTEVGYALVAFGVFVLLVGVYVQLVAPESPHLREDEEIVATAHPTQRVAIGKLLVSVPFFALTAYLYYLTTVDYTFPTVTLVFGAVFLLDGLTTYWRNTLTTYFVTNRRVITEYRFLSLQRREIPLDSIRSIEERKSLFEILARVGNVRIVSGSGRRLTITVRNIRDSTAFADTVRDVS